MSFIVQISPFVHLLRLKSFSVGGGLAPLNPPPGLCPGPAAGLQRPPEPSPQVVPTFHFIPSYAPEYVLVERHVYARAVVSVSKHYKNLTKLIGLVQIGHHYHLINFQFNSIQFKYFIE